MTRNQKVRRFALPPGVVPRHLIVGPDESAWFSYARGGVAALREYGEVDGEMLGRIAPARLIVSSINAEAIPRRR